MVTDPFFHMDTIAGVNACNSNGPKVLQGQSEMRCANFGSLIQHFPYFVAADIPDLLCVVPNKCGKLLGGATVSHLESF